MSEAINVLGISGSLRRGSYNTMLLRNIQAMLPPGTTLEIATLNDLPVYNGDDEDATESAIGPRSGRPHPGGPWRRHRHARI